MNLFRSRQKASIDDQFIEYITATLSDADNSSMTEDSLQDITQEAVTPFTEAMGNKVAERILHDARTFRRNRKTDEGFNRRLRKHWGQAFKLFTITQSCAQEAGERTLQKATTELTEDQLACRRALVELHAKACRVTGEVNVLLSNGFPEGALARCRTLHEFAVTASIIGDSVNDATHRDLAQRFLDHDIVNRLRNAKQYQADQNHLNLSPLDDDLIDQLEERYQEVLVKYGDEFKREYGWAKKYCPDDNFRALEKKAGMAHMRTYYQWASSEVHSSAMGLDSNRSIFRGQQILRVGKVNAGLAEPAAMAINSLHQTTVSLMVRGTGDQVDMTDLITMKALEVLRKRTTEEFLEAEAAVQQSEDDFASKSRN
jgi:hypothetical protein